jgi:hypothetical protein
MSTIKYIFYHLPTQRMMTYSEAVVVAPSIELRMTSDQLAELDFARMYPSEFPIAGDYQRVKNAPPIFVDGKYIRQYQVVDLFPEDIDNGDDTVYTVDQQKADYDAQRHIDLRIKALAQIESEHKAYLSAGLPVKIGTGDTAIEDVFELDPMSLAVLQAAQFTGTSDRRIFCRNKSYLLQISDYDAMNSAIQNWLMMIHEERANAIEAIKATTTLAELRAYLAYRNQ